MQRVGPHPRVAQPRRVYAGILGACFAGCTYVPLSPKQPEAQDSCSSSRRPICTRFLAERLQRKGDAVGFVDSDSLVLSGRLDSLDVVGLLAFIEEAYGIDFSDGFDQTEVDTLESILLLVQRGSPST